MADARMSHVPPEFHPDKELAKGFMEWFEPLHKKYTPRQQEIIQKRREALNASLEGKLPEHRRDTEAQKVEWKANLPEWCQDQRNQMTGPADDAALSTKLLNSGSPGVMLDLEDSEKNAWLHTLQGIENCIKGMYGELWYFDEKRDREVTIKDPDSPTVILVRPRGLHLSQAGLFHDEVCSASLFDVAYLWYQLDTSRLKHNCTFYIPKSEFAEEAEWWRDLFQELAADKGLPKDYIKCMALIESHPIAYQMEEFAYILRDHIMGLNLGRWDYMASLIHFNYENPDWVLPDRNTIPHDVPFFQNLRDLIPEICHKHGFLAMGGMTALYPSRVDPDLDKRAKEVLAKDKKNEADCLFDGAWTGHPDQNEIAVAQFPYPNQIHKRKEGVNRFPDLRPVPKGVGKHTVAGTRAAIKTVIRYRHGVLNGKGASLLDGYMEDLATDRIYRLMIAQRMHHRDKVTILDEDGKPAYHSPEFITRLFDEELERILASLPADTDDEDRENYRRARHISEEMILQAWHDPV